jgi:uncharacterized RDD family membrane protein YckC
MFLGCVLLAQLSGIAATLATILVLGFVFFLLVFGYFTMYETFWSGQTPGKRALRIRVIKVNGYPIDFVDALVRNVVRLADFLPSFYGVGLVVMFVSTQSRRLGDYAAGTIVVKERRGERTSQTFLRPVPNRDEAAPERGEPDPAELEWDLRALGARDMAILREYLTRSPELPADVRRRIGSEMAAKVAGEIGAKVPADSDAFLGRVVFLRENE